MQNRSLCVVVCAPTSWLRSPIAEQRAWSACPSLSSRVSPRRRLLFDLATCTCRAVSCALSVESNGHAPSTAQFRDVLARTSSIARRGCVGEPAEERTRRSDRIDGETDVGPDGRGEGPVEILVGTRIEEARFGLGFDGLRRFAVDMIAWKSAIRVSLLAEDTCPIVGRSRENGYTFLCGLSDTACGWSPHGAVGASGRAVFPLHHTLPVPIGSDISPALFRSNGHMRRGSSSVSRSPIFSKREISRSFPSLFGPLETFSIGQLVPLADQKEDPPATSAEAFSVTPASSVGSTGSLRRSNPTFRGSSRAGSPCLASTVRPVDLFGAAGRKSHRPIPSSLAKAQPTWTGFGAGRTDGGWQGRSVRFVPRDGRSPRDEAGTRGSDQGPGWRQYHVRTTNERCRRDAWLTMEWSGTGSSGAGRLLRPAIATAQATEEGAVGRRKTARARFGTKWSTSWDAQVRVRGKRPFANRFDGRCASHLVARRHLRAAAVQPCDETFRRTKPRPSNSVQCCRLVSFVLCVKGSRHVHRDTCICFAHLLRAHTAVPRLFPVEREASCPTCSVHSSFSWTCTLASTRAVAGERFLARPMGSTSWRAPSSSCIGRCGHRAVAWLPICPDPGMEHPVTLRGGRHPTRRCRHTAEERVGEGRGARNGRP